MKKTFKEQRIKMNCLRAGITVFYDKEFDDKNGTRLAYCEIRDCMTYRPAIYLNWKKPIDLSNVIHELIHAVRFELNDRKGFEGLNNWGDEVLPYTVQYCYEEIVKYCKKHKIKIKM